jgi:hypothetical protein
MKKSSTPKVQAFRARNKAKGYLRRDVYATDAEFRAIKALLKELRLGNSFIYDNGFCYSSVSTDKSAS